MALAAVLPGPADFAAWRLLARGLLGAGVAPEGVEWRVAGEAHGLFAQAPAPAGGAPFSVPRAFVALAELAIRHRDRERFALLYALLWRLTHGEPALMQLATDAQVARAHAMARAVRRDAHKMHAFLRFRQVETEAGTRHIAWFEPDHHIEEAEAGFFVRRFASLRWSIVTPRVSTSWDGHALQHGPGGRAADVPPDDAMEPLWRAYYAAIFNPARLKPAAMRSEMPRKYWRNMPETAEIPRLMAEAPRRVAEMVARAAAPPNPRPQRARHLPVQPPPPPPGDALGAMAAALVASDSLPDWASRATQPVFGEGPLGAALMFVGEQPGDEEDIAGRPFIGPAGTLFDDALQQAGIARAACFVTNAVKHFKFTPNGRRRLHQAPDAGDIARYRPFLLDEVAAVRPRLLVALGGSALLALTGEKLPVLKMRGRLLEGPGGCRIFATVHPSYVLRVADGAPQPTREHARFVADLAAVAAAL
jgi:DNA polymerase